MSVRIPTFMFSRMKFMGKFLEDLSIQVIRILLKPLVQNVILKTKLPVLAPEQWIVHTFWPETSDGQHVHTKIVKCIDEKDNENRKSIT